MPEAAEILTEALGRPIAFAQTPIEPVRQHSEEMALMLQWFERVGYSADIAGLEREFGRALTKLPDLGAPLSQMKSFKYRRKKYEQNHQSNRASHDAAIQIGSR